LLQENHYPSSVPQRIQHVCAHKNNNKQQTTKKQQTKMPPPTTTTNTTKNTNNNKRTIRLGICSMEKKTSGANTQLFIQQLYHQASQFYLTHKQEKISFEFFCFSDETIVHTPVNQWTPCDAILCYHCSDFPIDRAIDYIHHMKHTHNHCRSGRSSRSNDGDCPFFDLNHVELQRNVLLNRKTMYEYLQSIHVPLPHPFFIITNNHHESQNHSSNHNHHHSSQNNSENNHHHCEIIENANWIEYNGVRLMKPFVEKPLDANNHNIFIYLENDSGCRKLFRKKKNKSSALDKSWNRVRKMNHIHDENDESDENDDENDDARGENDHRTGHGTNGDDLRRNCGQRDVVDQDKVKNLNQEGYLYEPYQKLYGGKDIKVYMCGDFDERTNEIFDLYVHAEQRKSPSIDGIVERANSGLEHRDRVNLTEEEMEICRKILVGLKQRICGFDILRVMNEDGNGFKSIVCDVNGYSNVKSDKDFYYHCARITFQALVRRFTSNEEQS